MKKSMETNASAAGTFFIGGSLPVHRLGFGAMQLTGPGVWGEPKNPEEARAVLRRAVDFGVNLIDTADSYGPGVSERLIAEALYPYPDGLVIATKGGFTRQGPDLWTVDARPEYLLKCIEMSLKRLKLETIDLYQLHRIDSQVPLEDTLGALKLMQDQGKIRYIGLSEVNVRQIQQAKRIVDIATVQNDYSLANRRSEPVFDFCEENKIGFIPYYPLGDGRLVSSGGVLEKIANSKQATPAQIAIAWLLKRSPVVIPIPGTSSQKHLEENIGAATVELTDKEFNDLSTSFEGR